MQDRGRIHPAGLKPFQELQYGFTRHIRDPRSAPAPEGVEDRRMEIYRDLLYQNVQSFLAGSFPVLRKISADEGWHDLIRDYFKNHRAHTPLFPKMPQEFLQYLEHERGNRPEDLPFLAELAHYEWVELALAIDSREIDLSGIDAGGDLLDGVPILSPLALPLAYRYPVHRIRPDFLPERPPDEPTYLIVYRDRADHVGFLELNAVAARLVELLQQEVHRPGRALLDQIAAELRHPDPTVVYNGGRQVMEEMRAKDILLGVVRLK